MTQTTKTPIVAVSNSRTLADIVENSNGQVVQVVFQKASGEIRNMNCRLGVTCHLRGGKSTVDPDKFITVYDMQKQGYRSINKSTIISVKHKGAVFTRSVV